MYVYMYIYIHDYYFYLFFYVYSGASVGRDLTLTDTFKLGNTIITPIFCLDFIKNHLRTEGNSSSWSLVHFY